MTVDVDAGASACKYVYAPIDWGGGTVTITFDLLSGDEYYLWARVACSNWNDNSFTVSLNDGPGFHYEIDPPDSQWTWKWARVHADGQPDITPLVLAAGSHKVSFEGREANVRLDSVFLTNYRDYVPAGVATPCVLSGHLWLPVLHRPADATP